jgi:diacylglycerol kinase family enzyme
MSTASAQEPAPAPAGSRERRLRARVAAVAALVVLALSVVPFLVVAVNVADVLVLLGCLFVATYCTWLSVTRTGPVLLLTVPAVALALAGLAYVAYDHRIEATAGLVGLLLFGLAARAAVRAARDDRATGAHPVPPARQGVLVINPRSGNGKAARVGLAGEAARRGVRTIELGPGDDLRALVEQAVDAGADVLGMAGGDGSQAVVAAVASARGVALVCVPAGTRNHFALDLGLDRDDPVGALDAFTDGVERRVDLAAVNGRVFVNNASLGLYASVVQSESYRNAKLRTWRRLLPDLAGPGAAGPDLRFDRPGDTRIAGATRTGATLVVVSNNPYELRRPRGAGTRARLDTGTLGILDARLTDPEEIARFVTLSTLGQEWRTGDVRQWSAPVFLVDSPGPVAVGLDGEATRMTPPLRFETRPGALRVRLPAAARGLSPAGAAVGMSPRDLRRLLRIAAGR